MNVRSMLGLLVVVLIPLLAGCATAPKPTLASSKMTKAVVQKTSAVVTVMGPYDAAKACVAKIPGVKSINIGVGHIADNTGKINTTDEGTGTFISQGVSDFFNSALMKMGVKLVALSPDYRGTVDWIGAKGVKGSIVTPQFMVTGSVTALDFMPGSVAELSLFGFGPKTRAYTALGRMDVQLVTLPYKNTAGGVTVTASSVAKQFVAAETETGFASFVGNTPGVTFASFRVGKGEREPIQHTMSFMADYAAADLILKMLENLSIEGTIPDQRKAINDCRMWLDDPLHTTQQVAQNRVT